MYRFLGFEQSELQQKQSPCQIVLAPVGLEVGTALTPLTAPWMECQLQERARSSGLPGVH